MTQAENNRHEISEALRDALLHPTLDPRKYNSIWDQAKSDAGSGPKYYLAMCAVGLHLLTLPEASGMREELYRAFKEILALPKNFYQFSWPAPVESRGQAQYSIDLAAYEFVQATVRKDWGVCIRQPGAEMNAVFQGQDGNFKTAFKAALFVLRHMTIAEFNLVLDGFQPGGRGDAAARVETIAGLLENLGAGGISCLRNNLAEFTARGTECAIANSPSGKDVIKYMGRSPWQKNLQSLIPG